MSNEHFFELAIQAKELGATHISAFGYGEPLIDKKLFEKILFCSSLGLETFITTNASLLNKRVRTVLWQAGLTHIRFSVHGVFKNFELAHKGLKWGACFGNITDFIYENLKAGKPCKVSVSVIPMHGETVEQIRGFWEPMIDWLEIWKPHNWAGGRDYRKVIPKKKSCGRPFNGPVQIQADGKMIVCCWDINGVLEVGDTHKQTIEQILKGDKFNAIREKHKKGDVKGLICEQCDQRNTEDSPLLFSSRDKSCGVDCTSSTKFKLKEI